MPAGGGRGEGAPGRGQARRRGALPGVGNQCKTDDDGDRVEHGVSTAWKTMQSGHIFQVESCGSEFMHLLHFLCHDFPLMEVELLCR